MNTPHVTALPLRADVDDQALLEQVITFYRARLKDHTPAQQFLQGRGLVDPELAQHFELGFADRELGRSLPPSQHKAGREIRSRLAKLGIYRPSGHGHFNGSLVLPLRAASGEVADLYGRKIGRNLVKGTLLHTYLPAGCRPLQTARGVLNIQSRGARDELILTDSILNALTFWCAGLRHVSCTLPDDGLTDEHLSAIRHHAIGRVLVAYRNTEQGSAALDQVAARLRAESLKVYRIEFPPGMDAGDYARRNAPVEQSLRALVRQATRIGGAKRSPVNVTDELTQDETPPDTDHDTIDELAPPAAIVAAEVNETDVKFSFDDRHYRVRGLEKNHSLERMKINLLVERRELMHVDSLDLYGAQARWRYIKHAATELYVEEPLIKQDLAKILLQLETLQEQQIRAKLRVKADKPKELTDAQRDAAELLLRDPRLLDRILADYEACGLVGEETNKLVCYLGCVSRLLDRPLAIMIQSSSAAGKTTLMDGALSFVPPEHQIRYSAMTGQSLYYMGPQKNMRHKVLAVSEEEGVAQASYALKLLQSDGRLKIASAGKNSDTGRQQTQEYEVEGPVMMLLTTTSETPDPELQNRCITLRVNESEAQTAAIHAGQIARYTLAGQRQLAGRAAICQLHQNAQRLLEPKSVLIPWADRLTFRRDHVRMRRDFDKYLALVASVTLLYQYQRERQDGYLRATLDDVEVANRLAAEVLGQSLDDLLPQTRQLLVLMDDYLSQQAQQEHQSRLELRFTQRQLREALGWQDRSLRRHLLRLVELEYVLAYRTGRGNERHYQLLYDGQGRDGSRFMLGLVDVSTVRKQAKTERTGSEPAAHRHPIGTLAAGTKNGASDKGANHLPQSTATSPENGQAEHAPLTAS